MPEPKARRAPAPRAERQSYHHGDLKNALLEGALQVLSEVGPEAFTLREVARRAGVNHRAAYRHYADKSALLAAVAEEGFTALGDAMERELAHRGDEPEDRLRGLMRAYVGFAVSHRAHYNVMFGPRLNEDGRFPALEVPIARAFHLLEAEVQRGLELGRFRPARVLDHALALWAAVHGFTALVLVNRIRVRKEKLLAYSERILEGALLGLRRS